MNQILQTKLNNKKINLLKTLKVLKFQFYLSLLFIALISTLTTYNTFKLYSQENYSNQLLNNYNITKLYSNNTNTNKNTENSYVMGIIKIPKIDVYYPIFSVYDDNLLKISPCKFYGSQPGKSGNLCIAGHNYDNSKFFSKIATLSNNDEIIIYDNSNIKYSYFVYDIYEVKYNDLSPVYSYDSNSILLTLITCNNLNNNRIIVKALYKQS